MAVVCVTTKATWAAAIPSPPSPSLISIQTANPPALINLQPWHHILLSLVASGIFDLCLYFHWLFIWLSILSSSQEVLSFCPIFPAQGYFSLLKYLLFQSLMLKRIVKIINACLSDLRFLIIFLRLTILILIIPILPIILTITIITIIPITPIILTLLLLHHLILPLLHLQLPLLRNPYLHFPNSNLVPIILQYHHEI